MPTARAVRKLLSIYVFSYFPFSFEGKIWDLIVSVPDHGLSFSFLKVNGIRSKKRNIGINGYQPILVQNAFVVRDSFPNIFKDMGYL